MLILLFALYFSSATAAIDAIMEPSAMTYSRGPMSVSMGLVTGAVDDLMSGYESLVTSLPDVAQRVSQMQNGTEDMAKRLEVPQTHVFEVYYSCL